jgi:alanyl-tRNA synthetase
MDSQLLYQQDVSILEFEAEVMDRFTLADKRIGVVLDRTYFYPTGGGQEHDSGTIGSARVVDVFEDEAHSRLVHVVEGELGLGSVKAKIDQERRLRHMQHHTAQHLLTQCILRQTGYETVSANINGYSPSTLDIETSKIDPADLDQAELMANQIIYADRVVKTYFVSPDALNSIPLRRPPKVTENIRIVEIDAFDYSPCGGTHVLRSGSIGLVKVLKTERQNDKIRVYFNAGLQAMQVFHQMYGALTRLANKMSTSWQDIPDVIIKQADQLAVVQKELQMLRQNAVRYEARELADGAVEREGFKLGRASFIARPASELRILADLLKVEPDLVTVLSSFDGQKASLIVTCGEGTGKDARLLLNTYLGQIGGRGGGDARLAQGGGAASEEQYRHFLAQMEVS